ncbi:MAG: helix-turn-helix domain-containing protein [Rhodanobacteraceae bacterium]
MTPAEFKTIRERLGLSAEAFGKLLTRPVRDRTVRMWEAGDRSLPDDAAEFLLALDAEAELAVDRALGMVAQARAERGEPPQSVTLVRYATPDDLAEAHPELARIGLNYHAAIVGRVREALERASIETRIVFFDHEAYRAWLGKRRDSSATRAAWAAEQSS